jgi:hypothetical protein
MDHLKGASLALAPALPANIRLGWNGLPGKTLLQEFVIYSCKMSYNIGHSLNKIK